MRAKKIVLAKPSAQEVLKQITPFVTDEEHEKRFLRAVAERRALADKIVNLAKLGRCNTKNLLDLLEENPETINALISLLGISQEEFYRHVTLARIEKHKLQGGTPEGFAEWKRDKIIVEMKRDSEFAALVFALLLEGIKNKELSGRVPPFLLAKLDGSRLQTIGQGGIDALVRIGLKGPYDAAKGKPVVKEVQLVLDQTGVKYQVGEITVPHVPRKFDRVIPNSSDPHVMIEVGVFATTARELSEKGMVEQLQRQEVRAHYPEAVVVRVLDGVGWIARGGKALLKSCHPYRDKDRQSPPGARLRFELACPQGSHPKDLASPSV